jgi:hypothetical protein
MKNIFKGLGLGLVTSALVLGMGAVSALADTTYGANVITESGALTVNAAPASALILGSAATTGAITIGGTAATTGALTVGSSSGINTENIGTGTGATTLNIGTGAAANVITIGSATSTTKLTSGAVATHVTDATVGGSSLILAVDPTAVTGRYNTIDVESNLTQTYTGAGAGVYGIRGNVGVASGQTFKGTGVLQGYVAGVQGKLTVAGTLGDSNGSIYAMGGLSQVNVTGAIGANTQIFGQWVDNQSTTAGVLDLLNLTNNGNTVTNAIHVYGNDKLTNFMSAEHLDGAFVPITGNTTNQTKGLKVVIDGTTYYIVLQSATI